MRRREFIAGLGSAAAWPVLARAQQAALPVIGFLSSQSADAEYKHVTTPFLQGLKETGYVDGQNVSVQYGWAENQYDRLPALAADLVRRRVAVLVAAGTPAALAAKPATTTIPIVFSAGGDPVALGLVASLNRPGANVTGISALASELSSKQLQLLHMLPQCCRVRHSRGPELSGYPIQHRGPAGGSAHARATAKCFICRSPNRSRNGFRNFFATAGWCSLRRCQQLLPPTHLAALAALHALPAIFPNREYALAGGLMSYGTSLGYGYQQVGIYTGRILKGEKPAELPVQQVTKIEMIINLKTARALGITIPETLLATADEVIQ
jgi:putative ABC transport system substrate-binding protein